MIAAGFGCRAGCSAADVRRALELALAAGDVSASEVLALYSADFKVTDLGLRRAAAELGRPLFFLPRSTLAASAAGVRTHSAQVAGRFQLPSVAETAALAGALALADGRGAARLLGARQIAGGAACVLARAEPGT